MAKTHLDQVKKLLPFLETEELRQLIKSAEFFIGAKGHKEVSAVREQGDDLLYEAIADVLHTRLRQRPHSLDQLQSKYPAQYKNFLVVSEDLSPWVKEEFGKLTKVQRVALYRFFASIVADRIAETEATLGLTTMLKYFNNLPGIVDRKFPGYARNRLLTYLVT